MPNWCENDLWIEGASGRVQELLSFVGMDRTPPEFDFNALVPYPEEFRQADEITGLRAAGFNSGGYEWRVANWGTKWAPSDCHFAASRHETIVSFRTAWSPPTPVVAALHKRFDDLTLHLEYFERGMEFCGGVSFLSRLEWDDRGFATDKWEPGLASRAWTSYYGGQRGG